MTCQVLFDDLRFLTSSRRRRTRIPTSCALSLLIVSKGRHFGTGSLHLRCGTGSANLLLCGFVFNPFQAIWRIYIYILAGFFCQSSTDGARKGTNPFSVFLTWMMCFVGLELWAAGTNGCVSLCFGALRWGPCSEKNWWDLNTCTPTLADFTKLVNLSGGNEWLLIVSQNFWDIF